MKNLRFQRGYAKRHGAVPLYGVLLVGGIAGLVYGLVVGLHLPYIWSILLAVNVATFISYGYDKKVSGTRLWRLPERFLHLLSFVGGSPSAFLAQRLFRHKTAKSAFQRVYWAIVFLQLVIVGIALWQFDCVLSLEQLGGCVSYLHSF